MNSEVSELSEKFEPFVITDAVLMSQGIWNDVFYSKDEISKAHEETDWNSRERSDIYLDHEDTKASEWIGEVRNKRIENENYLGDLYIYDPAWATKLKYGKPKIGISPKVSGSYNEENKSMHNFTFENFSLVLNPAVKTAYIYNWEVPKMDKQKNAGIITQRTEVMTDDSIDKKAADDEIIAAAEAILKERKEVENLEKSETLEEMFDLFENINLKGQNVAEISAKAREIKNADESWKDAFRRASKMAEDELKKAPVEETKEIEAPAKDAPIEVVDVSNEELKELKAQIEELKEKLKEPYKTQLLRRKETATPRDVDEGMMAYLQEFDTEVG